jgi:putative Ca2+/H+ antiporter (TMEM165/GDT1 family)
VLAGSVVNKYIPMFYIQLCSGIAFIILGVLLIFGKM